MSVETAVRETGAVHDRVDADAVEAMLTKQPRRGFHDPLAILRRLLPTHPHLSLSSSLARPLTGYMTTPIYANRCRSSFINDARRPRVSNSARGAVLGTGASSGVGATFADRLARRGNDRLQVQRNRDRLEANASRLRRKAGVPPRSCATVYP